MNTADTSTSRDSVTRLGVVRRSVRSEPMAEPLCNHAATRGASWITPPESGVIRCGPPAHATCRATVRPDPVKRRPPVIKRHSLPPPRHIHLAALLAGVSLAGCGPRPPRPMPPATTHDPKLEAEAMRAVGGTLDFSGRHVLSEGDQILSAHIVSDFDVVQNELGVPVKRQVSIVVIVKKADGSCEWDNVWFSQKHMGGGSYGGLRGEGLNDKSMMPCPSATTPAGGGNSAAGDAGRPTGRTSITVVGSDPSDNKPLDPAQIDEVVASLGPTADAGCKAYVREVCVRARGEQGLVACKTYGQSIKDLASSPQGPSMCKTMLDSLSPAAQ